MSVDLLQEKIRKTKNPSVVMFDAFADLIPPQLLEEAESTAAAYEKLSLELLSALKGLVGAVRFGFGSFALWGPDGLQLLSKLMREAKSLGYYVLLDAPEALSAMAAKNIATALAQENCAYPCDGIVISAYLGSDVLKPFQPLCKQGKALFPIARTGNRSAPEIQDLLTGARLVHTAVADIVTRQGEGMTGKFGYSQVGAVAGASGADSLRSLRAKYNRLFLLLDGFDYPNANAKNCSYAFDKLGRGAAACAGTSIVGAWKEAGESSYISAAVEAAERMKKNLTRYITVL